MIHTHSLVNISKAITKITKQITGTRTPKNVQCYRQGKNNTVSSSYYIFLESRIYILNTHTEAFTWSLDFF